jgi:hypothetical protein
MRYGQPLPWFLTNADIHLSRLRRSNSFAGAMMAHPNSTDPPPQRYDGTVPEHDTFHVVRLGVQGGGFIITVRHEVPPGAEGLAVFPTASEAIDRAQDEARRSKANGESAEYVEPPDDLVGTG